MYIIERKPVNKKIKKSDYRHGAMMRVCYKLNIMIYLNCVPEVHLEMRERIGERKR